jgi:uncharacterized protein YaaQ
LIPPDSGSVGIFMPTSVNVMVGGAVVFVVDAERFERF